MADKGHLPYLTGTEWTWASKENDFVHRGPIELHYEIAGSFLGENLDSAEVPAIQLWRQWVRALADGSPVSIEWTVEP